MGATYESLIAQNLTPGPGTYTFSVWFKREANFLLSSMQIRLEWYDPAFTNRVQADSVTTCTVPNDTQWHQYFVTGTCEATNLFEVRAAIAARYIANANATSLMSFMIDDAVFYRGEMDTDQDSLPDGWENAYFHSPTSAQPGGDEDHDGANNYQEYMADTCPTNIGSCFDADFDCDGLCNEISFYGSAGRVYTLQFSTNLMPRPAWRTIHARVRGEGCMMDLPHSVCASNGYYRLKVDLP
jgi:hypothetical protein